MPDNLTVRQFSAGSCYSYILDSMGKALIIDPHISLQDEYAGYLKKKGLELEAIVDTHTHADHFSLAAILKKKFGAPVLMHEKTISSVATGRLKDGDRISLGEARLKIIYTPGHTDDAVSLYGEGRLFTGDVLLIGSIGRTDFQNGSPESMFETLQKLRALPDETRLFPGHDYNEKRSSTLGREKEENPFLKETGREAFVNRLRGKSMPKPFNIENIIRVNQAGEAARIETVSPREAFEIAKKNPRVKLLDVRSTLEFSQLHINASLNIPIDTLPARTGELAGDGQEYIVFCRTGNRSPMAADMLIQAGINSVRVMQGGTTRWQKEGLPIVRGEGGISLERQVRIAAGSLVFLGIAASRLFHPAFILLPLFVSVGLVMAGLTDNCLMGMLLMRLPYNKRLYRPKAGGTCSASG